MNKDYLNKIIYGDALTVLKSLPNDIVDIGVTSPPYNKGKNKKGWLVANVKYSGHPINYLKIYAKKPDRSFR